MRLGGVGLKEAERVRGWSGMGGGKKFWGTFFCGLVLILGGLRTPARGAEPGSEEQRRRALEIRLAISRLSETQVEERESLYHFSEKRREYVTYWPPVHCSSVFPRVHLH